MTKRFYTGIGSRSLPEHLSRSLTQAATYLEKNGFTLRSGGARGADEAFELGVTDPKNKEIYLPWAGFNNRHSMAKSKHDITVDIADPMNSKAILVASQHHPAWTKLPRSTKALMTRNSCQVLGIDMNTPSEFILCWTPAGEITGGTGQALRIAKSNDIKIINFGNLSLDEISTQLQELTNATSS